MRAQLLDMIIRNSKSRRLCVTAVARQNIRACPQSANDIDTIVSVVIILAAKSAVTTGAACRTSAVFSPFAQHEDGAIYLFRELTRDKTDDAFRPVVPADQHDLIVGAQLRLLAHATHQGFCLLLPRDIEIFQLFRVSGSRVIVIRSEQVEGDTGIRHTPGGIDARRKGKSDIALSNSPWLQIGLFD